VFQANCEGQVKMSTQANNILRQLADLAVSISQDLTVPLETPVRPFTRGLTELFDIFSNIEASLSKVPTELNNFQNEETIGLRVQIIHRAGNQFPPFGSACASFTKWVDSHFSDFWYTAGLASESIYRPRIAIATVPNGDIIRQQVQHEIELIREQLQATRSPDPKLFPSAETVDMIAALMHDMASQYRTAKNLVRDFAVAKLTVSDFF
jgi:hypothetical protein